VTDVRVPFDSTFKQNFVRKLAYLLPPFDRFVAKGELPEQDPVFPSREEEIKSVAKTIKKKKSMIIPVISEVGAGKTHFLWGIYNSFDIDAVNTFLTFPRSKEKFLYYLYSNFIKQFGQNKLRDFSQHFGEKFGAAERLYGLFRTQNSDRIALSAIHQLENDYDLESLTQCVNVCIQHLMNSDKSQVAERWLLGQLMDVEDLFSINVTDDLSKESMAKTMLKLILEHNPQDIVFLFDDLDKAATEFDNLDAFCESSEDINWAGDLDEHCDDTGQDYGDFALLEELLKLMKDVNNLKIVVTLGQEEADKFIEWFKSKQNDTTILIADPIYLRPITLKDTYHLYFSRMRNFCLKYNVQHPTADRSFKPEKDLEEYLEIYGEDLYFPLSKEIVQVIYGITFGNPRLILKNFKRIFDAIIFEEVGIDEIHTEYKRFLYK
jgi:hypothetical protein